MNVRRHLASLALAALLAHPAAAEPGASDWAGEAEGRVRLISAQSAAGGDGPLRFGVQIRLAPGWHTYWRDPGESGAPPEFDWSGSQNVADVSLTWPAPRRFQAFGLDGFGWEEEVVFPVTARLAQPGAPARLRLRLAYQICEEICVPVAAELALELAPGEPAPTPFAPLIERWAARAPGDSTLQILGAELAGAPGEEVLYVRAKAEPPLRAPDLFAEAPPFRFGRPEVERGDGEVRLALPVHAGRKRPSLAGREVVLTLTDGERAAERRIKLPPRR